MFSAVDWNRDSGEIIFAGKIRDSPCHIFWCSGALQGTLLAEVCPLLIAHICPGGSHDWPRQYPIHTDVRAKRGSTDLGQHPQTSFTDAVMWIAKPGCHRTFVEDIDNHAARWIIFAHNGDGSLCEEEW